MFTDSHCHISKNDYENIDQIVKNYLDKGVHRVINNGTLWDDNHEVLELSGKYPSMYAAIGYHPEFLDTYNKEQLKLIDDNIEKIVAIGEIGLDYYINDKNKDEQIELFDSQLKMADKYHKPVIVHSRNAYLDTVKLLEKYPNVKGSIHCFEGTLEEANKYISLGYKLGFNGIITFKNTNLIEVIKYIPLESILLETDSPCLSPVPLRGKKNEPANISIIAEKICEIKKITKEELSRVTEANIKELFDI